MRTTKNDVEKAFKAFCVSIGKETGFGKDAWDINFNSIYGGWVITSEKGSKHPFTEKRMGPKEFVNCLKFATQALHISFPAIVYGPILGQ